MEFLFLLYAIKHGFADLALQRYFVSGSSKETYFNKKAQLHYLHHSVLTAIISAFFFDIQIAVLLGIVDHLAHWHIDYAKTIVKLKYNIVESKKSFWLLQTADQSLHFITYYFLILLGSIA